MSEELPELPEEGLLLTSKEEDEQHMRDVLASIPPPSYKEILSPKLKLHPVNEGVGMNPSRVARIARNWSDIVAEVLTVVRDGRKDQYWVVNGRHRFLATKCEPNNHPRMLRCLVYEDLNDAQMNALFWVLNNERRTTLGKERYLSRIGMGSPVALAAQKVLQVRGVENEMTAYTTCLRVVERARSLDDGEQVLDFTIRALTGAFGADDQSRLNSQLIEALALFFDEHGTNPKLTMEKLQEAMNQRGRRTARQLQQLGAGRGSSGPRGAVWIMREIEDTYAGYSGGHRL